ncbi:MAG TPA: hypothetical protein VI462_14725 [Acidimicrobiia bacterium]
MPAHAEAREVDAVGDRPQPLPDAATDFGEMLPVIVIASCSVRDDDGTAGGAVLGDAAGPGTDVETRPVWTIGCATWDELCACHATTPPALATRATATTPAARRRWRRARRRRACARADPPRGSGASPVAGGVGPRGASSVGPGPRAVGVGGVVGVHSDGRNQPGSPGPRPAPVIGGQPTGRPAGGARAPAPVWWRPS